MEGYPIGSLLLWEREAPSIRLEFGPVTVEALGFSDAQYVVDGQQRLTSQVGVLAAPADVRGDFELHFDLAQEAFRYPGSGNPPSTWVPLRLALDTNALLSWLLGFKERGGSDEHVDAVTTLGERLSEYRVPVSIVRNALRVIFDRMNNVGRRLTKAEVFQALHAAADDRDPHDLSDLGDAVAGIGFGSLRDGTLLRSVLAIRGGNVFRDFRRELPDFRRVPTRDQRGTPQAGAVPTNTISGFAPSEGPRPRVAPPSCCGLGELAGAFVQQLHRP